MSFDLLAKPLVYMPVKWQGLGADNNGDAIVVDHEVTIQVELLTREQLEEWSAAANLDKFATERAELNDRISAAIRLSNEGGDGASALLAELTIEQNELNRRGREANRERDVVTFTTVAHGWKGVLAQGSPVPFNPENARKLLAWPGFGEAFAPAYRDAVQGKLAVREGNSEGSPANGPAVEPTDATKQAETPSS
jgi:hypothetical protein